MEEWRPVSGFEAFYEVSNHGRVRSLPRRVFKERQIFGHTVRRPTRSVKGTVLKPRKKHNGYFQVSLCVDGRVTEAYVQRLVLAAFVGPQPTPRHQAAHLNGLCHDNRPENLQWASAKENSAQKVAHGTNIPRPNQARRAAATLLRKNGWTTEQIHGALGIKGGRQKKDQQQ